MSLADHDRPLNPRGKKDAPYMAKRLLDVTFRKGAGPRVDGIMTSTAKRARQTAKVFAEVFGLGKDRVIKEKKLYHAGPRTIEQCIQALPEEWDSVLIFGHNPGFSEAANRLQNDDYLGEVPTCSIVASHSATKQWSDWTFTEARRVGYWYPKQEI